MRGSRRPAPRADPHGAGWLARLGWRQVRLWRAHGRGIGSRERPVRGPIATDLVARPGAAHQAAPRVCRVATNHQVPELVCGHTAEQDADIRARLPRQPSDTVGVDGRQHPVSPAANDGFAERDRGVVACGSLAHHQQDLGWPRRLVAGRRWARARAHRPPHVHQGRQQHGFGFGQGPHLQRGREGSGIDPDRQTDPRCRSCCSRQR